MHFSTPNAGLIAALIITAITPASALPAAVLQTGTSAIDASSTSAPTAAPLVASSPSDASTALTLLDRLRLAPTILSKYALLSPTDYIYDFLSPPLGAVTTGPGGHTVKADPGDFPALLGTGVSITVGFLGPCGFNTPHTHARAAEFNLVIEGSLMAEVMGENGAPLLSHTLQTFQGTIFPQSALHTEFNPGCGNATFVAAFGGEDPGVLQSAQSFFGLGGEIVEAVLGAQGNGVAVNGAQLDRFKEVIPKNVALGVDQCLRTCKLGRYA